MKTKNSTPRKKTHTRKDKTDTHETTKNQPVIRYAVVGLGYIAQIAVLPAFEHAKECCQLNALVSDNPKKLQELGKKYNVQNLFSYDEYDECLHSGLIDAVYIALPNSMHYEYTIRAAEAGIHVLCEKPLAITVRECKDMIAACHAHGVQLMTAYRLHFDEGSLEVLDIIRSGKIGEPVIFNSTFSMQVAEGNIRTREDLGGGTLFDIGIYCINAARSIFDTEPQRVTSIISNPRDRRFEQVDGLTGAILEFGQGRVASFVTSFAAADTSCFEVVGTKGSIRVEKAFEFEEGLNYQLTIDGKTKEKKFKKRDQFGPELIRFAETILSGQQVTPSGEEGLADIRTIQAIYRSAKEGREIELRPTIKVESPSQKNEMRLPPISRPHLYNSEAPSRS